MTTAEFHRLAAKEYRAARERYRKQNPAVAERFSAAIDAAVMKISGNPEMHPQLAGDVRFIRVRRFPFLLIFKRQSADSVLIVAVAHGRRRPGYWRRRI